MNYTETVLSNPRITRINTKKVIMNNSFFNSQDIQFVEIQNS
jgi:hypothetical protein